MVFTSLSDEEETLLRHFVQTAVDRAGGFAGFRKSATKTISVLDRLEDLTLPRIDDVRDGLGRYIEVKTRAEELDEKIDRTESLIDEIVYGLYDLTREEREIIQSRLTGS